MKNKHNIIETIGSQGEYIFQGYTKTGQSITQRYFFYTKKEAKTKFRKLLKQLEK